VRFSAVYGKAVAKRVDPGVGGIALCGCALSARAYEVREAVHLALEIGADHA
jgi:hypothetical protein